MMLMVKVVIVVVAAATAAVVVMPAMRGRNYFIMKLIRCGGGAFKGVLGRHFRIRISQLGAIQ